MSGAGWTAGKKLADDGIDKIREKLKEHKDGKDEKENKKDSLEDIEIPEDEEK
jgi:hypothetical protein